jgi:hypothetical protein
MKKIFPIIDKLNENFSKIGNNKTAIYIVIRIIVLILNGVYCC